MEELLKKLRRRRGEPAHGRTVFRVLATLPPCLKTVFVVALFVFLLTSFASLIHFSERFLVLIPRHSGSLSEGIIGRPRFINPIIAKSDADRDMVALLYSGLLRATPEGEFIPDLAASYSVSPDGLTYTFILRDNIVWHDGEPITSQDVVFTIEKIRDPGLAIKSPRRASWEGVLITAPDAKTVIFHIRQPYAPFLENATMGIIPKHIWQNVSNEEFDVTYHNIEPIGSGPYRMDRIVEDKAKGLPQYYDLVAFTHYALGEPYITHMRIAFFGNNKELSRAYDDGAIEQMHTIEPLLAEELKKNGAKIVESPLPRIFALYFNQSQQPLFADKAVRRALAQSVDKDEIVREVLHGYGKPIDGPLPSLTEGATTPQGEGREEALASARATLEKAGWTKNGGIYEKADKKKKKPTPLEFSIALPDVTELRTAAELIKHDWEKLGARVTLKVFDQSTFAAEVLSPRKYDILFYGQITGRTPDPFAYWHSSQRKAPGLNVALYTNKQADKLLEGARKERDPVRRTTLLDKFVVEVNKDIPAIFIYSPHFLYAVGAQVMGINIGPIATESERFLNVYRWYVASERVWRWFAL